MTGPRRKLVLLTEIIAPYRIPVFNALAQVDDLDLHVIFFSETDETQRYWHVHRNEIRFSYEVLPSWRRRFGRYHLLLNRGLGRALRRTQPQVVLCGGYNYLASWQALWWTRRAGVPFMIWVESTGADRRNRHGLVEFLKRKFMRSCRAFVVAGKSSTDYVRAFGADEGAIFQAPNAVDTDFFAREAAQARATREETLQLLGLPQRFFLFAGRLIEEKGVFDLLQAYGRLPETVRSSLSLVVAGEGPARTELQARAASVAPGSVKFAGFLQREELARFYGLAEAFVFPTHSDPWGLVVNEAMACSLPVICSRAAGCAADLISDGENGRLVDSHDVPALASAMLELAQNEALGKRMGEQSWRRIQAYSPAACAAGIAAAARTVGSLAT